MLTADRLRELFEYSTETGVFIRRVTTGNRSKAGAKSGIKGVSLHKLTGRWRAHVGYKGKQLYLGLYDDLQAAENIVKLKRAELHGEYANHG